MLASIDLLKLLLSNRTLKTSFAKSPSYKNITCKNAAHFFQGVSHTAEES
jgi:hypothetical protein